MSFAKLSSGITKSSLWSEELHVRIVFLSFLAEKDETGFVEGARSGLIRLCNVTADQFDNAIMRLTSPDLDSKSQEFEGRRIAKLDGGYLVLNSDKYRLPEDTKKENHRIYMQKWREEHDKKENFTEIHVNSREFTKAHERSPSVSVSSSESFSSSGSISDSTTVSDINTSSENSNSSDSKIEFVKKKEKNIPEFAIELAKYLHEKIVESGTDAVFKESHILGWANDFRLMVTADKKTVEDIRKKVDDIFMNEFWSKQIRSAGKLRKQWNAGKLDNLKQRTAAWRQQTNEAEEVDRYASEKRYDSGRCRRYIDAMLRRLFPGDKWEEYIIPEADAELEPIWEIIVADGGYINGVKTKDAALKIVGLLRKYS